jgi:hypothetical protein
MGSNFPHGFNHVTIRGVPVDVPHPGNVYWVNNSTVLADGAKNGSDGNKGTYKEPFATLDYAVGKCLADRGDVIYVMPGHSETITAASAIDFDVAGVTVIGLGSGSKQPVVKSNHADATVVVDADNVTLYNLRFTSTITAVAIGISVLTLATDFTMKNCRMDVETTTTDEHVIAVNFGVGCDNFLIEDCVIDQGLGGAATGIKLVGATAGGTIRRNRIVGDYSQACIAGITTLSTEIYIEDNFLANGASGNVGAVEVVEMLTGTTGVIRRNHSLANVATIAAHYVADTMAFYENYATEDVGQAAGAVLRTGAVSVTASADD